jgi:hypothetical protein
MRSCTCFFATGGSRSPSYAITNLFPILKHFHGIKVELYFTELAIERSKDTAWDDKLQQIMTIDEVNFDSMNYLASIDDEWFDISVPDTTPIFDTTSGLNTPSSLKVQK